MCLTDFNGFVSKLEQESPSDSVLDSTSLRAFGYESVCVILTAMFFFANPVRTRAGVGCIVTFTV